MEKNCAKIKNIPILDDKLQLITFVKYNNNKFRIKMTKEIGEAFEVMMDHQERESTNASFDREGRLS